MTDLYQILGVTRRATSAEIKSAYRRLARQCHPDVSASPDANARFADINEAYHVLSDPGRRANYDRGGYVKHDRTFYASRAAEVAAIQRKFDRMVDEMLARERQETAARSHAVLLIVPLFLSAFYFMIAKPPIIERFDILGRALTIALGICGLVYLIKNLSLALSRYTYEVPDYLTSVFREERPQDKVISRKAGLFFLVCGYLVSLGLGYVVGKFLPLHYGPALSPGTLIGIIIYPPIAVLIIGSIRLVGTRLGLF